MNLFGAYKYIYYKIYMFMLSTANKDNAEVGASCILSLIVFFYLLALILKLTIMSELNFNLQQIQVKILLLVFLSLLYLMQYILFERGSRYLKVVEEFSNEEGKQKRFGGIVVILIFTGSLISFFWAILSS